MNQYRQGDVMLIEINEMPKKVDIKNKVIAKGEVTGHSHRFESEQVQVFENDKNHQFVRVQNPSELIHEEHANILIPKGVYRVIMQREFDIVEGIRQVMD